MPTIDTWLSLDADAYWEGWTEGAYWQSLVPASERVATIRDVVASYVGDIASYALGLNDGWDAQGRLLPNRS